MRYWSVGELAKETGLTVRTLHHWEAVGLLTPSHRTASGHRRYGAADVARLQQVVSLRQLGMKLEEVRECLSRPGASTLQVVQMHLLRLREQMEMQRRLCRRLEEVAERLRLAETVSVEEFLKTIEAVTMYERYFTPEQREQLRRQGEAVGRERVREVEAEWPALIAEVRAAMERGEDEASGHVRQLARRWMGLVNEFTGGDPGVFQGLSRMYAGEPAAREQASIPPEMLRLIGRAWNAARAEDA